MSARLIISALLLLLSSTSIAAETEVVAAVPGGIAQFSIPKTSPDLPIVRWGLQKPVIIDDGEEWQVIVGIDHKTLPGEYIVYVKPAERGTKAFTRKIRVLSNAFIEEQEMPKIEFSSARTFSDLEYENTLEPALPLSYPVEGNWQNQFGQLVDESRRRINFLYLIANERYVSVTAPQRAIVSRIVEHSDDDSYQLFLDHGRGLYSIISGIENLSVKLGDGVNQRAVLGTFRMREDRTLLWQCVINGAYINPTWLLR